MNALHKSRGDNKDTRHKKRSGRENHSSMGGEKTTSATLKNKKNILND